jgi:hypothetical protein
MEAFLHLVKQFLKCLFVYQCNICFLNNKSFCQLHALQFLWEMRVVNCGLVLCSVCSWRKRKGGEVRVLE